MSLILYLECHFSLKNYDAALSDLRRCQNLDPEDSDCAQRIGMVYATLGTAANNSGRYVEAIYELTQVYPFF
jgi:tetratricopeptide (TPR) repeat protein